MDDVEYLNTLGMKIRKLRKEASISQQVLAEKLGTKHTQIGRIERGEANVTIKMLGKIALVLGIPLNELVKL